MTLIILLIALTIERISATADIWQFPFYYQKMKAIVAKHMGEPRWLQSSPGHWLWLILPVLTVQFLAGAMDWLILDFAFSLVVLLICIGCVKERKLYKSFLNATKRDDLAEAQIYKSKLCNPLTAVEEPVAAEPATEAATSAVVLEKSATDEATTAETVTEEAVTAEQTEEQANLGQTLVWLNFRNYCAVLFWFVCLGPAGAVLYCMVRETADDQDGQLKLPQDKLQKLLHILDWLPARACTAGYLLIGNFSKASGVWVSYLLDFVSPAKALICEIAEAAEPTHEAQSAKVEESTRMLKLAKRNVLFFLALVALLTLVGGIS